MIAFLSSLDAALHKHPLDEEDLKTLKGEWLSLWDKDIDTLTACQMLSSMSQDLDIRRKEIVREYLAWFLEPSLLSKDNFSCPYHLQRNKSFTMPFKTWKEEVLEVNTYFKETVTHVQFRYFMRCKRCGDNCSYRIFRSENGGLFWRKSEYDKEYAKPKSRQQKAADTRTKRNKEEIEKILRPLCGMLADKGLAIDVPDEDYFIFKGSSDLYAFIAWQVTDCSEKIDDIPWDVIIDILKPPCKKGNVMTLASEIKNKKHEEPKESADIMKCLENILEKL